MQKHSDLIYDVGFHQGEDTAFYLKKGFRVVAFEAHPRLAEQGRVMFADAARAGRFTMVEGAIVSPDEWVAGTREVTFYVDEVLDTVGSTDQAWTQRFAKRGATTRRVSVAAVDFVDCLRTHGVPHYMKIDIEGSDRFCLESLRHVADLPADGWMDRVTTAATYEKNFALLRTCGERSLLGRIPGMGRVLWSIETYTGLPLVAWQDTHARLASA